MKEYDGLILEIENMQDRIAIDEGALGALIEGCVLGTLRGENFTYKAMVSIGLVDNPYIKKVNNEFRGIDEATDVLSFPILDISPGDGLGDMDDFIYDRDPDTDALVLGDILISLERAEEQAKEYGHSFNREVGFLVVHGMLHLLGHDHIEHYERAIMRKKEETILEGLGLLRN